LNFAVGLSAGVEMEMAMSGVNVGAGRVVTVFGGSGFVGRYVVRALARDGWRVRVACRAALRRW